MVAFNTELKLRNKYILQLREGVFLDVVYRGSGNDIVLARLWPHEFITRYPPGSRDTTGDSVFSLRIREDGFRIENGTIILIPDENGRAFFSNSYFPTLDNSPLFGITTEQREGMLKELIEAGI